MNALTPVALRSAEVLDSAAVAWTGRPDAWAAAKRIWRLPWIAAWFAVFAADGARLAFAAAPVAAPRAWSGEGHLLVVGAVTLAGLGVLAVLTARTTCYEIGGRALTLRYGLALPATLVIPFAAIEAVAIRPHRDGADDVALRLKPEARILYLKLWPHARPWRLFRPEPMLRGVRDAGVAAGLLCREVARAREGAV